jgi:hypothetical protein
MTCTPLNIQPGLFITSSIWDKAHSKTFDGKTVTLTPSGANPGIEVQQGSHSLFHSQLADHTLSYMVLGNKYLLILDVEDTGVGIGTRRISLVNFDNWTEVPILLVSVASSSVDLPIANPSQGNGVAFFAYGQDGTQHTDVAIHRSDNGKVLCELSAPIVPTGQTCAGATATQVIIYYSTNYTSQQESCNLPAGKCTITPSSQTFPDVAMGGCPFTPPTKQFTIKNTGDDCLTVNSISSTRPFSVQNTTPNLPATLSTNETVDVTVAFNPTVAGDWSGQNSIKLNVVTSPANGDNELVCEGKAVAAQPKVQFNHLVFDFGTVPVGKSATAQTLSITNNGSAPLVVSVPVLSVSGFSCAGWNGTLDCGKSQTIALGFNPPSEGPQSATLNISTNTAGSPHSIKLKGNGCLANALIEVPQIAPISFGQVEQGYRTVRFFKVLNTGDGQLTFKAAISGPNAALFGLPDPLGSVTNPPSSRTYAVDPVSPCGGGQTGTGEMLVAVSFFANDTPKIASATLTLNGHNATNFPSNQTWQFPMNAEITQPVALDIGLVVDRSGSMTDPLGSRCKIDAAMAASQLFVELLRPDLNDRVAIVRFNHHPEVVIPMSAVSTTTSPTQNDILYAVQTGIPPAEGRTAIAGGSMTAFKEVQSPRVSTPAQLRKSVIVLTDGIENTGFEDPPGSGQWYSILGEQVTKPLPSWDVVNTTPMVVPSDINVYAVGLGPSSDIDANQLNALASPNNFFHVDCDLTGDKYFQLEKYYTLIFMQLVGTSSIADPMYWIMPGEFQEIEFDVLRGDTEVIIVLFDWKGMRLPFYCLSPTGQVVDPALVPQGYQLRAGAISEARFVEFKLPSKEPDRYAGRWKVHIEHPGRVCMGMPHSTDSNTQYESKIVGFLPRECKTFSQPLLYGISIGVGSNFRMMPFLTPGSVYVGEPILMTTLISEAGLPVTGCDVTVDVISPSGATETMELYDDGTHNDSGVDDGEYANAFTHTYEEGTYHFRFRTIGKSRDGEPVVREALRDEAVLKRMPQKPTGEGKPGASEECCKELLEEIRKQSLLLKRALASNKAT